MIYRREKQEESVDRNKSELTHKITALACGYLTTIGCKPVETEVSVSSGWIADVASYWYPTNTELKYAKLLRSLFTDESWGNKDKRLAEFNKRYAPPFTVMVEVKKDKQDFIKDLERKFYTPIVPANLCYLAYPSSLDAVIQEERNRGDFVFNWGLIKCSDAGERIVDIHAPVRLNAQHPGSMLDFIAQVGIRRDHRTAYRFMRMQLKNYRAQIKRKQCVWTKKEVDGCVRVVTQCGNVVPFDFFMSLDVVFCPFCGDKVLKFLQ